MLGDQKATRIATSRRLLASVKFRLGQGGWRHITEYTTEQLLRQISLIPAIKRVASPSLRDLYGASDGIYFEAKELFEHHFTSIYPNTSWETISAEFRELYKALELRATEILLPYPSFFSVDTQTALLLYAMTRLLRPDVVLETGVANGWSSFVFLSALNRNGSGMLYSVDVANDVGQLVGGIPKNRWHLMIIDRTKEAWNKALASIPPVDFFLHDSDHSYSWQATEYRSVCSRISKHGVLASDDVDSSYAFLDFARRLGRRPILLIEKRKVMGLVTPE